MCTGAELIPLLTAAVGTGATVYSQQAAQAKQDREAAAGIMRQRALSDQAQTKVAKNIQDLNASNPDQDIQTRQSTYMDALRRSQGASKALPNVGGASSRFAEDVGAAQTENATNAGVQANLQARIDAPGIQRQREAVNSANTVSDLSLLGGQSAGQDYLTRLRMSAIKPNPWISGAGQLAQGVGSGLAVNGGWGAGTNPWADDTAMSGFTAAARRGMPARPVIGNVARGS